MEEQTEFEYYNNHTTAMYCNPAQSWTFDSYSFCINGFIDWDKTTDVVDGDEEFFLGTFCEYNDEVKDLRGTLVLKGGKETNWYLAMDDDTSITECINAVLEFSEKPESIFKTSE